MWQTETPSFLRSPSEKPTSSKAKARGASAANGPVPSPSESDSSTTTKCTSASSKVDCPPQDALHQRVDEDYKVPGLRTSPEAGVNTGLRGSLPWDCRCGTEGPGGRSPQGTSSANADVRSGEPCRTRSTSKSDNTGKLGLLPPTAGATPQRSGQRGDRGVRGVPAIPCNEGGQEAESVGSKLTGRKISSFLRRSEQMWTDLCMCLTNDDKMRPKS